MIDQFQVKPNSKVNLKHYQTDWSWAENENDLNREEVKQQAEEILAKSREELSKAQELLYASNTHSVLLIFQAMDAAGKDGTIAHVMSGVDPQGCQVYSFKQPSAEEMDHNFLWRYMKALPERGRVGIFNRSYYEDVLVVKVHPEWINEAQFGKPDDSFWEKRYEDINNFEKHLHRNGTLVLKFFLHISKDEQKQRFLDRLNDPTKHWKWSDGDLVEREHWKDYQRAFEDAISATSTKKNPWYIIPADRKPVARALVAEIIVSAIQGMKLEYPKISEEQKLAIIAAKNKLESSESSKSS
ncbi:MAG: polyphosphate kinase 2 family protein [Akkermansiaceae bacterium]|nr:polyphosphate kinase 2 family protein [Akkermansiaceae bacterium]